MQPKTSRMTGTIYAKNAAFKTLPLLIFKSTVSPFAAPQSFSASITVSFPEQIQQDAQLSPHADERVILTFAVPSTHSSTIPSCSIAFLPKIKL